MIEVDVVQRAANGERAATEQLIRAVQDDIYGLAMRMLGLRAEAEDATQEVLLKVLRNLRQFRGDSSFRTWVWRIAANHVLAMKKGQREDLLSFDMIEMLIARGATNPAMPEWMSEAELQLAAEEVRLSCTEGMLLSLNRDERIAFTLAEVFELDGDEAAAVLEVEPATFRKRLSRARERLGDWMSGHCGIVDALNACRCARQIPVAMSAGAVDLHSLQYAGHPRRGRARPDHPIHEADRIERAAQTLCSHPDYAAPEVILDRIRCLIDSGEFRLLS